MDVLKDERGMPIPPTGKATVRRLAEMTGLQTEKIASKV